MTLELDAFIHQQPRSIRETIKESCKHFSLEEIQKAHTAKAAQEHENAIRQALEQTQWQPIETAPKDGTPVLTSDGGFMCYVAYLKDDNWIIFSDDDGDRYWFPTIWTPFNLPNGCKHNWVSARNKVVTSGEMCTKCFALRPEPPQPEKND